MHRCRKGNGDLRGLWRSIGYVIDGSGFIEAHWHGLRPRTHDGRVG
jgi:hypothetical protein